MAWLLGYTAPAGSPPGLPTGAWRLDIHAGAAVATTSSSAPGPVKVIGTSTVAAPEVGAEKVILKSHTMLAEYGYDERNPIPMVLEYRIQHADGEWIWIRDTKYFISFGEKGIDKIVGKFERIGPAQLTDAYLRKWFEDNRSCTRLLDFALANKVASSTISPKTPRLTNREKEILRLIGDGFSTKMIADKRNISINTVETHRRRLLAKLEVSNSMQLIKEASRIIGL